MFARTTKDIDVTSVAATNAAKGGENRNDDGCAKAIAGANIKSLKSEPAHSRRLSTKILIVTADDGKEFRDSTKIGSFVCVVLEIECVSYLMMLLNKISF
jgi:hypothetical protein